MGENAARLTGEDPGLPWWVTCVNSTDSICTGIVAIVWDYLEKNMADLHDLNRDLKKLRDELSLRMHLASMEAKQEWNELETKWQKFSSRAKLEDSAEGVGNALELLGEELKKGYKRLKVALKH